VGEDLLGQPRAVKGNEDAAVHAREYGGSNGSAT
jgi:hypothetical protein